MAMGETALVGAVALLGTTSVAICSGANIRARVKGPKTRDKDQGSDTWEEEFLAEQADNPNAPITAWADYSENGGRFKKEWAVYRDGVLLFTDSCESYESRPYIAVGDGREVTLSEDVVSIGPGIDRKTVRLKFQSPKVAEVWLARLQVDAKIGIVDRLADFQRNLVERGSEVRQSQESHETKMRELEERKQADAQNKTLQLDKLQARLDTMLTTAHENEESVESLARDMERETLHEPSQQEILKQARQEELVMARNNQNPNAFAVSDAKERLEGLLRMAQEMEDQISKTQQNTEELERKRREEFASVVGPDQGNLPNDVCLLPVSEAPPASAALSEGQQPEVVEGEAPSMYRILREVVVTEDASMNSANLPTTLQESTIVEVLEVRALREEGRIRGRIGADKRTSGGWISLKKLGADERWAVAEGSAIGNAKLRWKLQDMERKVRAAEARGPGLQASNGAGKIYQPVLSLASQPACVSPSNNPILASLEGDPSLSNFHVGQPLLIWSATRSQWFDDGQVHAVDPVEGISVRYNADQTTKRLPFNEIREHVRMWDADSASLKLENIRLKNEITRLSTIQPAAVPANDVRHAELQREADEHRRLAEEADRRCSEALERTRRDNERANSSTELADAQRAHAEKDSLLSEERQQFQAKLQEQDCMIADIRANAPRAQGRADNDRGTSQLQMQLEIQNRRVQDLEEVTRNMGQKERERGELQRALEQQIEQFQADNAALSDSMLQVRRSDEHHLIAGERASSLASELAAAQAAARDTEARLRDAEGLARTEQDTAARMTEQRNTLQSRLEAAQAQASPGDVDALRQQLVAAETLQKELAARLATSEASKREAEQAIRSQAWQDSDRVKQFLDRISELEGLLCEADQRAGQAQAQACEAERRAEQAKAVLLRPAEVATPTAQEFQSQLVKSTVSPRPNNALQGLVAADRGLAAQHQPSDDPGIGPLRQASVNTLAGSPLGSPQPTQRQVPQMPSLRGPHAYPAVAGSPNAQKSTSSPIRPAAPAAAGHLAQAARTANAASTRASRLSSDGGRPTLGSARETRVGSDGVRPSALASARDAGGRAAVTGSTQGRAVLGHGNQAPSSMRPVHAASGLAGGAVPGQQAQQVSAPRLLSGPCPAGSQAAMSTTSSRTSPAVQPGPGHATASARPGAQPTSSLLRGNHLTPINRPGARPLASSATTR